MGVYVSRNDDAEMYKDAYEEAQRIIRISDEIRISLEKVERKSEISTAATDATADIEVEANTSKFSTSKVAKRLKLKTPEFIEKLVIIDYLALSNDGHVLTQKGINAGGEFKKSNRFGDYFVWPEDLEI
jgi:hypothetical protein